MKKFLILKIIKLFFIVIILGVICINIFTWFNNPKFITHESNQLIKIIVIFESYLSNKNRTIYTIERSVIIQTYNILNNTIDLYINKHPKHIDSIQWDPDIIIFFEYFDGNNDKFYLNKNGLIVKFLNTSGNSNDPGYIIGSNNQIWEHLSNVTWSE